MSGFSTHSLRATAATNALERGSDIAEVQEWMGHDDTKTLLEGAFATLGAFA